MLCGGSEQPDTEVLLSRARGGDETARQGIFALYRDRLRAMVAFHMDPRLRRRFDPSDVVQEALADAWADLSKYLERRPVCLYVWLRSFAWKRLVDLHRKHLLAKVRSVKREVDGDVPLPDASSIVLAERLAASLESPLENLVRAELQVRVQEALGRLRPAHREVLVLRYLEGLSVCEIADVLAIKDGAVKKRHLRALQELRSILNLQ